MYVRRELRLLLCASTMGVSLGATAAVAQDGPASGSSVGALEEIVVTARRRNEDLQSTPVAVTAVTAQVLETRNVTTLEKIAYITPNFHISEGAGGIGTASIAMRGITYVDNTVGQDLPIGIYVDGVSAGRITTALMQLVEPDQVEVLRGPQGTLFGRNTTAGAILISTHTPSDEFSGKVRASYGSYNANRFTGRIDTGLLGNSGVKATFSYDHTNQNGTHDSGLRPRNLDPGADTNDSYFAKVVGEWGNFSASLTGDYTEMKGVPATLQIIDATPAQRTFTALSPSYGGNSYVFTQTPLYYIPNDTYFGVQRNWAQGVTLNMTYEFSPLLTIKSISSVRAYKRSDPSAYGPADLRGNVGTVAAPVIASFNSFYGFPSRQQSQRQRSQEFQILGAAGDFDYVAGFYYFKEQAWDYAFGILPLVAASGLTATNVITQRLYTIDSKSIAGFGQVDWRPSMFDQKLEISGGIRWTKDDRSFAQTVAIVRGASLHTKNTSFLVSANYKWTDDVMTYVKYSTGYRAGGFNVRAGATVNPVYTPEKIKALEGGFKAEAWDHRLRLNGSVFYNKYRDLQLSQFQPPGIAVGSGGSATVNANAKYKGFELELQVVPTENLTLSASVGYVDPVFKSYPRGLEAGAVPAGCTPINNAAGVAVGADCAKIAAFTNLPKKNADVSARYVLPEQSYGQFSFQAWYSWKGPIEYGTFQLPSTPFRNVLRADSYGVLGGRIALSDIPLTGNAKGELSIFGDNLTNEKYATNSTDFGFMATTVFSDRRTFGIEGKVEF